ncbi:hypothetical protein H8R20_08265 [Morganella morganii]|uniref:hypothetical protein n=1 Tax=Morganella morganii TaxID=582 RepID=UPI00164910C9|nr:hypothetical protein [Morganella morganii]MBC3995589.1 hypothetical protein [Morganella morganii]
MLKSEITVFPIDLQSLNDISELSDLSGIGVSLYYSLFDRNVYAKSLFIDDSLTYSLAKGAKELNELEYYYLDRSDLLNRAFYGWLAFVQRIPYCHVILFKKQP